MIGREAEVDPEGGAGPREGGDPHQGDPLVDAHPVQDVDHHEGHQGGNSFTLHTLLLFIMTFSLSFRKVQKNQEWWDYQSLINIGHPTLSIPPSLVRI